MADNEHTDERNGVSRANEQVIRAIVRDELRGGEADERDGGVTRREVLEAAGLVGVGALGGTTAMNEMVGTAEAATGTGNLGTAENPLDTLYTNNLGDATEPVQAINTDKGYSNERPFRTTSDKVTGGSGTYADPWQIPAAEVLQDEGGLVFFDAGHYITDSIVWPAGLDYGDETTYYIEGPGMALSTLKLNDGVNDDLLKIDPTGTSNMGGVRDLTLWGNRANNDTGHVVNTQGIYDMHWENVIIRYAAQDCLHIEGNAAGHRLTQTYLENADRHNLYMRDGDRNKVVGTHQIGSYQASTYLEDIFDSQFWGGTVAKIWDFDGGYGVELAGTSFDNTFTDWSFNGTRDCSVFINSTSYNNQFTDITVKDCYNDAFDIRGTDNKVTQTEIRDIQRRGFHLRGDGNQIENAHIQDFDRDVAGYRALDIKSSYNRLRNVSIEQPNVASYNALRLQGADENYIDGLHLDRSATWTIEIDSGSALNIITNLTGMAPSDVTDNGTLTIINGRGTNAGNPQTTGQWNGNVGYAEEKNVTVHDTTNDVLYDAVGGAFVAR